MARRAVVPVTTLRHHGEQGPHRSVAGAGRRRRRAPAHQRQGQRHAADGESRRQVDRVRFEARRRHAKTRSTSSRSTAAKRAASPNIPTGAGVPKWFPDSERIAFVSEVWPDLVRWEDQAARKKERESSKMTARVWTKAPISYFDHFLDDRRAAPVLDRRSTAASPRRSRACRAFTCRSRTSTAYLVRHLARWARSGVHRRHRQERHRSQLSTSSCSPTCGCKPPRNITRGQQGRRRCAALQPRMAAGSPSTQQRIARFYADRERLMLFDRAAGHHRRPHGELGSLRRRPRVGARLAHAVRHDRRRRHAPRLSLSPRRRNAGGVDEGVLVRRAGAGRAMARVSSRSARVSASRPRWSRSRRAATR